jgi:U4/U6.U5 tri-snRNP component SNU23
MVLYCIVLYLFLMKFSDQKTLGFSMRVERANTDQVKDRIDMLKQKIHAQKNGPVVSAVEGYDSRLAAQALEGEQMKRQKKEQTAAKKKEMDAADMEDIDPEIAAMLGFGGFGSSKK